MNPARVYFTTCSTFADWTHVGHSTEDEQTHCKNLADEFEVASGFQVAGYCTTDNARGLTKAVREALADHQQPHGFIGMVPVDVIEVLTQLPDASFDRVVLGEEMQGALGL